ncbi:Uncharacterised protein [Bordetella pertussis]|nr:Uncharacterised protein [Bordetella pertussis]
MRDKLSDCAGAKQAATSLHLSPHGALSPISPCLHNLHRPSLWLASKSSTSPICSPAPTAHGCSGCSAPRSSRSSGRAKETSPAPSLPFTAVKACIS